MLYRYPAVPFYGLPGEVKDYPGIRYIISSNGAKVYDIRDGRILFQDLIPYKWRLRC